MIKSLKEVRYIVICEGLLLFKDLLIVGSDLKWNSSIMDSGVFRDKEVWGIIGI